MSQANPVQPEPSSTIEKGSLLKRAFPWVIALIAVLGAIVFSPLVPESFNRWQLIPWLLMVLAIVTAVYFRTKPSIVVGDGEPMAAGARLALTVYLLAFGCGLVFMLVSLNSLDFPETAVVPQLVQIPSPSPTPAANPTPIPAPGVNQGNVATQNPPQATTAPGQNQTGARLNAAATPSPTPVAPILLRVLPQSAFGSAAPKVELTVYGRNFSKESKVRFNAEPVAITYISDNLITAPLLPNHLSQVGSITVDVENPPNLLSNAITVPVTKPTAQLNVFFWRYPLITREAQLLLLVIFAGALGSFLHAIMSLADFIGNRTLLASWFWWYITRPFLGMAMALVFYAVVRGGFLAGTPADANVVNPFGVLAIGALVGMFSDKAAQKLKEIFEVVFRAQDERIGKLTENVGAATNAPVIDRLAPDTVLAGGSEPVGVKIIGERLAKVSKVQVDKVDHPAESPSEKEVSFKVTPEETAQAGALKIIAVSPAGSSQPATLKVSEPPDTDNKTTAAETEDTESEEGH